MLCRTQSVGFDYFCDKKGNARPAHSTAQLAISCVFLRGILWIIIHLMPAEVNFMEQERKYLWLNWKPRLHLHFYSVIQLDQKI